MVKIEKLSPLKYHQCRKHVLNRGDTFFVELDGYSIKNLSDFLDTISSKLMFPIPSKLIDGYNDWMCDLSWISEKNIVVMLKHYHAFLRDEPEAKDILTENLYSSIIPWWTDGYLKYCVGGIEKNIYLYYVA